jgi:hypothetical protein
MRSIVVALEIGEEFFFADAPTCLSDKDRKPIEARHAILIVGSAVVSGERRFRIRNSWGEGWGDSGCIWVHWTYISNGIFIELLGGVVTDNFSTLSDSHNVSEAWLKAVRALREKKGQAYNLIYSVSNPGELSHEDALVISKFDEFARDHGINTVTATANTIFPLDFYLKNKREGLFSRYDVEIYPKVKKQWGNYFDRITRRRTLKGSQLLMQTDL